MRTTSSIAFFCRKSKANKQGLSPVEVSITICGSRKFLNLPLIKFKAEDFNRRNPPQEIIETLDLWRRKIDEYIRSMMKEGMVINSTTLREVIQQGGIRNTVGALFSDYLHLLKQRIGVDLKPTVYRKYELTAEKALAVLDRDADISTITPAAIKAIETKLKAKYDPSTVAGYLVRLKAFCRYGMDLGKITKNPFISTKIVKPVKPIRFLTEEEIMDLLGRSYGGSLQRTLDTFLIACATGMSYTDLADFKIEDLKKEGDYYYISKKRNKTGKVFNAIVLGWGVPIILHYGGVPYVPSNQVYNRQLKKINPTFHSHLARRTYASFLYNKNVSAEVTAAALGDTVQTTLRYYARLLDSSVIKQQINALK